MKKRRSAMLPRIQKILYATDLSPNSVYGFRYAIDTAIKHEAEIVILHVFEQITTAGMLDLYLNTEQLKKIREERATEVRERIRERLKAFCDEELKDHPEHAAKVTAIEVCDGFPAEEILKKAGKFNCDIIVMGTHGKGLLANTFLGSTAKRVLRRTRKPIFIVPLPRPKGDMDAEDF
jgi:nucleotide-binding universal stress UspA family protein